MNLFETIFLLIKLLIYFIGWFIWVMNGLIHSYTLILIIYLIVLLFFMFKNIDKGKSFFYGLCTIALSFASYHASDIMRAVTHTERVYSVTDENIGVIGYFFEELPWIATISIIFMIFYILMIREILRYGNKYKTQKNIIDNKGEDNL